MTIASGVGASIVLPAEAAVVPMASLFGERGGRALVAIDAAAAGAFRAAARDDDVAALRLGVASGDRLDIAIGSARLSNGLDQLGAAWATPFTDG
jgi:phosphoribosylformylglycinamidine (FGAM) synthase-like enzyme